MHSTHLVSLRHCLNQATSCPNLNPSVDKTVVVSQNRNNGNAGESSGKLYLGSSTGDDSTGIREMEKSFWDCICKIMQSSAFCRKMVRSTILNCVFKHTPFPRVPPWNDHQHILSSRSRSIGIPALQISSQISKNSSSCCCSPRELPWLSARHHPHSDPEAGTPPHERTVPYPCWRRSPRGPYTTRCGTAVRRRTRRRCDEPRAAGCRECTENRGARCGSRDCRWRSSAVRSSWWSPGPSRTGSAPRWSGRPADEVLIRGGCPRRGRW